MSSAFSMDAERTVMEALPASLRAELQRPDDPVVAAMAEELEGVEGAQDWEEPTDPGQQRAPKLKLTLPKPQSAPKVPAAQAPGLAAQSAPLPSAPLSALPGPGLEPAASAPPPSELGVGVGGGGGGPAPAFSAEGLVAKLEKPTDTRASGSIWTKEVIITASLGVCLLIGALIYNHYAEEGAEQPNNGQLTTIQSPPPKALKPQPPPAAPPSTLSPTPTLRQKPRQNTLSAVEETVTKTKTPMLTIVSTPPGALVEINGTVYDRTPLIMPSPSGLASLTIRLKKNGYKKWEEVVRPNAAGHFSVNVKLESMR